MTLAGRDTYLQVTHPVRTLGLRARCRFSFLRSDESFRSDESVDIPFCTPSLLNLLRSDLCEPANQSPQIYDYRYR